MLHSFIIHLSAEEHSGCLFFLTLVIRATNAAEVVEKKVPSFPVVSKGNWCSLSGNQCGVSPKHKKMILLYDKLYHSLTYAKRTQHPTPQILAEQCSQLTSSHFTGLHNLSCHDLQGKAGCVVQLKIKQFHFQGFCQWWQDRKHEWHQVHLTYNVTWKCKPYKSNFPSASWVMVFITATQKTRTQ